MYIVCYSHKYTSRQANRQKRNRKTNRWKARWKAEWQRDTAISAGKPEALLPARFTQGGYELSMVVCKLKFDNEDLTRDLVNSGVPEYSP